MLGFFSKIGSDFIYVCIVVFGGLLLLLGWRRSLISKGEKQAQAENNKHTINKLIKAKRIQDEFKAEDGEDLFIDFSDIHNELMWRNESVTASDQ